MNKTLPLLLAGLLAAGGAMAQSTGAGDSAMTTGPNSPSQTLNDNSASPPSSLPGSSGTGMSSAPADSTNTMGAGPATTVVVPVTPVAVVPAVPVVVDQPMYGRGSVSGGAQEGGAATLESNGGPYDSAWWGPRETYVYVPR